MTPRIQRPITIPPLDVKDPLLQGFSANLLQEWWSAQRVRAAGHISQPLLTRHGAARLFIADRLLQLWATQMEAVKVTGDKWLGTAHILNDARFIAVCTALEEYPPLAIANAIKAYAQECRTNPERQKKPWMRLGFDKFLRDALEVWVNASRQIAKGDQRSQASVEQLRHEHPVRAWYAALSPTDQHKMLREAIYMLTVRGGDYGNPTVSNPRVLDALGQVMCKLQATTVTPPAADQALG